MAAEHPPHRSPQASTCRPGPESLRGAHRRLRSPGLDHADPDHGPPPPQAPGHRSGLPRGRKRPVHQHRHPQPGARWQLGHTRTSLPSDLTQGPDRLLRYEVALRNHAGKSAGPSNPAYSAAGAGPPPLTGLTGQVRQDGVLLSWKPVPDPGGSVFFRIERLQLTAPAPEEARRSPLAPSVPPAAQTLAVHGLDGVRPGPCDRYLRPLQPAIPLCGRTSSDAGARRAVGRGTGTAERDHRGYDHRHFSAGCSPGLGRGCRFGCRRHRSLLVARQR